MPLIKSASKQAFDKNVAEMIKAGHPRNQSLAAAYATQHKAQGVAPHQSPHDTVIVERKHGGGIKSINHTGVTTGPLISPVPGRTDLHKTTVPSGSYVIPADIVSGHGEGNTLAGINALHKRFKMGTYGKPISPRRIPFHGITKKFGKGGEVDPNIGKPVAVKLAGGEIVVPPDNVHETMQREARKPITLEQAHQLMDNWVISERKKLRQTLAKLPGPVKE